LAEKASKRNGSKFKKEEKLSASSFFWRRIPQPLGRLPLVGKAYHGSPERRL